LRQRLTLGKNLLTREWFGSINVFYIVVMMKSSVLWLQKKKKTIFIEESHYTSVRFYFKLEDIPHSNSKNKIRVKKYEAYDIFIGRKPFKEQERLYREKDRSNNQNLE
jgi:hypothetical protein